MLHEILVRSAPPARCKRRKLHRIFDQRGFNEEAESLIREAVRHPAACVKGSTVTRFYLGLSPSIEQLRLDPPPAQGCSR